MSMMLSGCASTVCYPLGRSRNPMWPDERLEVNDAGQCGRMRGGIVGGRCVGEGRPARWKLDLASGATKGQEAKQSVFIVVV